MKISDEKFAEIQGYELEWWTNTDFSPKESLWERYTEVFEPYLFMFDVVADVGSGPVPYVLSEVVSWGWAWAIDPLIIEYALQDRYRDIWVSRLRLATSTKYIEGGECDGVFCLNTLDHVQDPGEMHRIRKDWLLYALGGYFSALYNKVEPSWKFSNDVFWYVGTRRHK